jgi:hypothetical protein
MTGVDPKDITVLGISDVSTRRRQLSSSSSRRHRQLQGGNQLRLFYSVSYVAFSSEGVTKIYDNLVGELKESITTGYFDDIMYLLASSVSSPLMDASSDAVTVYPPVVVDTNTKSAVSAAPFENSPGYFAMIVLVVCIPVITACFCLYYYFIYRPRRYAKGGAYYHSDLTYGGRNPRPNDVDISTIYEGFGTDEIDERAIVNTGTQQQQQQQQQEVDPFSDSSFLDESTVMLAPDSIRVGIAGGVDNVNSNSIESGNSSKTKKTKKVKKTPKSKTKSKSRTRTRKGKGKGKGSRK